MDYEPRVPRGRRPSTMLAVTRRVEHLAGASASASLLLGGTKLALRPRQPGRPASA